MTSASSRHTVLSLFTGAGGLDLGLEAAGFRTVLCVEMDEDARRTLTRNRPSWRLSTPGDIHELGPSELLRQARLEPGDLVLLAGGPPCQPFSKANYWSTGDAPRLQDPRSLTLNAYLDVVAATLPQVLLLENVRGLAFDGKDEGVRLLERGLRTINKRTGTNYQPNLLTLDAADFGVPQFRERVFIVASVDGREFIAPTPTHGAGRGQPFRTAWDAIGDLDCDDWPSDLAPTGRWARLLPSIPEGQNYLWHTPRNESQGGEPLFGWRTRFWSFLLKLAKAHPSWTIQAQPGPATGPFHWKSRLLSTAELSRLQTFPQGYTVSGDRRSAQRQIGNAVPSAIGELLGLEIRRQLLSERVRRELTLIPTQATACPKPELVAAVPPEFLKLRRRHADHPGPGLGPGARKRGALQAQA